MLDYVGNAIGFKILSTQLIDIGSAKQGSTINMPGILFEETEIELVAKMSKNFKLKSSKEKVQSIFRSDFKFEDMGIGGLDKELTNIFRRAFASRRFPPSVLEKYGIT